MAAAEKEVYCTLLLNDGYIPGAMVLARSLRDSGTQKQLAALVTVDSLESDAMTELKTIYDHVILIDPIVNKSPENLYLMHRPDLGSTFTKIALWRQTQFSKIVYLDADMVALRAPDELFDRKSTFAAVPDIGWPDCFNSGLMVLMPDMGEYYSLLALAHRGTTALQAATIRAGKPWTVGRNWNGASGIYEQMLGHWWTVYDRYYRLPASQILQKDPLMAVMPPPQKTMDTIRKTRDRKKTNKNGGEWHPRHPLIASNLCFPSKTPASHRRESTEISIEKAV
ncbi:MAG: hypothetical protein Q9174_006357 [Haloplaca sp. 1 TL-2023]